MRINLSGKVALVTGGNSGLGSATVRTLAECGAAVAINYVAAEASALELAEEVGGGVFFGDVSVPADVDTMVHAVVAALGPIDILVNNAGIGLDAELVGTTTEDWDRVTDVNLKGQFLCGRAVAAHMMESVVAAPRKIINVASELGLGGRERASAYVASKAGVIGLTKSWAKELAPCGIHVNAVAPGPFDTPMLGEYDRTPDYLATVPAGRLGDPRELGAVVAFLASKYGDFFIGQVLSPNGGVQI